MTPRKSPFRSKSDPTLRKNKIQEFLRRPFFSRNKSQLSMPLKVVSEQDLFQQMPVTLEHVWKRASLELTMI